MNEYLVTVERTIVQRRVIKVGAYYPGVAKGAALAWPHDEVPWQEVQSEEPRVVKMMQRHTSETVVENVDEDGGY